MKRGNKFGQIWIETMIYTLIAFVIIGLVLSFVKPKIQEIQDKSIIEQSISMMKEINFIILDISRVAGNKREIELGIKKGILKIDGVEDKIVFEIESRHIYSQPGEDIYSGGLIIRTEKRGKFNLVTLTNNCSEDYNITYQGKDKLKTISKASTPYKLFISNKGKDKFEDGTTCTEEGNCGLKEGFEIKCIGEEGFKMCEYTAEKITIDIEIV